MPLNICEWTQSFSKIKYQRVLKMFGSNCNNTESFTKENSVTNFKESAALLEMSQLQ